MLTQEQKTLIERKRAAAIRLKETNKRDRIQANRLAALERKAKWARTHGLRIPTPPTGWVFTTVPLNEPESFGCDFQLPGHTPRMLEALHAHPRDSRIQFIAEGHIYKVDGHPTLGSVTKLVHEFAEEFDADLVIAKMKGGPRWPRPEYTHPNGQELDDDEIKEQWRRNRDESANRGTWTHLQCELFLNGDAVNLDKPELLLMLKTLLKLPGYTAYRTEWEIFGEAECIAGSIDFVAQAPDGSLLLLDWKRSKQLRNKYSHFFGMSMKSPLDKLQDCAGEHYRLQLNCYRYLLQKYYRVTVSGMWVVCIHPDNEDEPFIDDVPAMPVETEALMSWQRELALRKEGGTAGDSAKTSAA